MIQHILRLFRRRRRPRPTSPPSCDWCDDGWQYTSHQIGGGVQVVREPCCVCGGVEVLPARMVRERSYFLVPRPIWRWHNEIAGWVGFSQN